MICKGVKTNSHVSCLTISSLLHQIMLQPELPWSPTMTASNQQEFSFYLKEKMHNDNNALYDANLPWYDANFAVYTYIK